MGQKPNKVHDSRSDLRRETGFETGTEHHAKMEGEHRGPTPGLQPPTRSTADAAGTPFHSKPAAEQSVPRNPKLIVGIVAGLLAIIALTVGMLFSGPTFVDETATETPDSMQFEANR